MGIEIAKIENSALKEAALQIDNQGCKNNFIDDFEINLFEAKAIELLIDKKCTLQEFATLFPTSDINQEDSYMNVDSVKITQSQPNKLEVLKMDEQDLVKKIEELQNEIKVKKEELQNFKKDADILIKAYSNPVIDLVAGLAG